MSKNEKKEIDNLQNNNPKYPGKRLFFYLIVIVVSIVTIDLMLSTISGVLLGIWGIYADKELLIFGWLLIVLLVMATKLVMISIKQIFTTLFNWENEKYNYESHIRNHKHKLNPK